ncbi:helix-turn-helix domain-containing protein [Fodinibius sediminis]|uniref:AraC-type DNA-binding protein n=1 Tax=Fodinibius sediminis TaxID=1214077 RepID=A0A521CKG7_9BACT|nr:helix-turn-helix domain-containing protein [Fodinibius sediminis]SMO59928.1 AraC-type DNA-binding protein [Fodinibius sediminis]
MIKTYRDTELDSRIILADREADLHRFKEQDFFKILWNRGEMMHLNIDGEELPMEQDQMICLTPIQNPDLSSLSGDYFLLMFNREFYCIHENDHEVSCEGLLFWGSSELPVIQLDEEQKPKFESLCQILVDEIETKDRIQGEMLRMLLKRLIIKGTRLARKQLFPESVGNKQTELIRQFNILVEKHFREYHQVRDYAEMLYKAPKTLSNVFADAGHKTPLEMIHYRITLEAKRQLKKTDKFAKEIAFELGFEEAAHFSRFFKKETGISPLQYRNRAEI